LRVFGVIKRPVCALWSNELIPFPQTAWKLLLIRIISASPILKRFAGTSALQTAKAQPLAPAARAPLGIHA